VSEERREIERLREGEEDGYQENAQVTPGQLLKILHEVDGEERIQILGSLLDAAHDGSRCLAECHMEQLSTLRDR
jgi:hypothetical protein